MVVLSSELSVKPVYVGERVRRCTRCLVLGIESPIRERSAYSFRASEQRFDARCWGCMRIAQSESRRRLRLLEGPKVREQRRVRDARWRAALHADPEKLERRRAQQRDAARRKRQDPVGREKLLAAGRRAKRKRYEERPEEVREYNRMYLALRREQEGKALRAPKARASAPKLPRSGDLRIGPFRRWVNWLVAEQERCVVGSNDPVLVEHHRKTTNDSIEGAVAERLGLGARQMLRIRQDNKTVHGVLVDHCTLRDGGSVRLSDLYPELDDSPLQSFGRLLGLRALYGLWYRREAA